MTTATGRVYKRGKKFYIAINKGYTEGKRLEERRVTNAKSQREAKVILETELFKLNRSAAVGSPMDNNYLLHDLFNDWLEHIQTVTPNPKTCREYIRNAELALKSLSELSITNVSGLLPKEATRFQKLITDQGLSSNIANKALVKLKAILDYGVENKLIYSNPIKKVPMLPIVRKKFRRSYTHEEVNKLLELAPPEWQPFFHFAVSTGCRLAEIQNLLWKDVDLKKMQIHIIARQDWKPKSKSGERSIPITEKLKETLSRLEKRSDYVFTTQKGTKRENNALTVLKRTVKKGLEELNPKWKKEKIEEELTLLDFHALRYTFCTELIKNGVDIKTVQKIMGHADIATTLSIYAQYCHGGMENAVSHIKW